MIARNAGGRRRIAQRLFLAAGIAALGYCLAAWIGADLYQVRQARRFARDLRKRRLKGAGEPAQSRSVTAVPRDGEVIGKLDIPRLGVSVIIVEGVKTGDLRRAVGHIPGTTLPGRTGNIGIAGHRDTFFRPLRYIRRNETIVLSTLDGTYRYRVVSTKVISPDDVHVLDQTGPDTLTLITCFPFYYIGAAPKRFIVRAEPG